MAPIPIFNNASGIPVSQESSLSTTFSISDHGLHTCYLWKIAMGWQNLLVKSLSLHLQLEWLTTEDVPLHPQRSVYQIVFHPHVAVVLLEQLSHLPSHPHLRLLRLHLVLLQALPQTINPLPALLLALPQTAHHIPPGGVELGPEQSHIVSLVFQFLLLSTNLILGKAIYTVRYV